MSLAVICSLLLFAGGFVTHTLEFTNTGNVALRGCNLTTDGTPLNITCTGLPEPCRLEVGSTATCQVLYGVDQDAIELGVITHSAEGTALPAAGAANGFRKPFHLAPVTATSSPSMSVTINTAACAPLPEFAGECHWLAPRWLLPACWLSFAALARGMPNK